MPAGGGWKALSRRRWWLAGSALLLIVALGVGFVLAKRYEARDVVGSSTEEFDESAAPPDRPPPPPPPAPGKPKPERPGVVWGVWGVTAERARVSPYPHRPPYRPLWGFRARSLVELPPVIGLGNIYFANNDGTLFAVRASDGKLAWRFDTGRVQAASPALDATTVYHAFMYRRAVGKGDPTGEVVALDALTGKVRWRRTIAVSESSPLVRGGTVYVGDWSGRVHAFDARTGRTRWTAQTGGDVKGGVSASGGQLFVGSYDSHVYSLDARTGRQLWRTGSQSRLGTRGRFYSTPAVAYGRVYIGATDGKVYSFGATSGQLRWSHSTGSYVYGSPAVWDKRVFVGSYDGRFYALDAASGETLWRFSANGPISGSATVVDGLVYFSTIRGRTYALDARTGAQRWTFPDGAYAGVVADEERLYAVGVGRVYALAERR